MRNRNDETKSSTSSILFSEVQQKKGEKKKSTWQNFKGKENQGTKMKASSQSWGVDHKHLKLLQTINILVINK